MKETKLDIKQIVSKEIRDPALRIIAIKGLNYRDVALLSKYKERYHWSLINSAYSSVSIKNISDFNDVYEAIFMAMIAGKTIYQFDDIGEFSEWLCNYNNSK